MAIVTDAAFKDRTADLGLVLDTDAACWVDIDSDGWTDLCAGGEVWRNNEGRSFSKITGVGSVVAADFDNDGYPDLFSCSRMQLFHNEQGKSFTVWKLPDLPKTVSRGACWVDLDNDGYVDLYIGGYEGERSTITYPSFVLMNRSGTSFELTQGKARFRTRGVTACDFDRDGDLDVYVSNYRLQPNLLWVNDGTGRLNNGAAEHNVVATSQGFAGGHSIGAAWGDFDNDGNFDLFAGNFAHIDSRGDQPKSRFLRNSGLRTGYRFEDLGTCGIFYQESYATPAAGDYDNDGNLDLFFTTVYATASFKKENHSVLFRNEGGFKFTDATTAAALAGLPPTYQAAWADFDRDGDLDLVTAGRLYENQNSGRHWLKVRLEGDGEMVNRSAIGTQVRIKLPDRTLTRQVEAGTGEGNQNDLTLHFGLGKHSHPVELELLWPGGKAQTFRQIMPDRQIDFRFQK